MINGMTHETSRKSLGDILVGKPQKQDCCPYTAEQSSKHERPTCPGDKCSLLEKGKKKRKKKKSLAAREVASWAESRNENAAKGTISEIPRNNWKPEGVSRQRKPGNVRPDPNSVVITIKCNDMGLTEEDTPPMYQMAMDSMRGAANLNELGIGGFIPRRSRDGGMVLMLPKEPGARNKAKALVEIVKDKMPKGVKIACPQRTVEIVVNGLDPSVTADEAVNSVAAIGECQMEDIAHTGIRRDENSLGSI